MQRFDISPVRLAKDIWIHRGLIFNLSKREIVGRYRGSFIGIFWSFLTPLLMLVVFTFVFGEIFQARWGARGGGGGQGSLDFAVALFAGLLIFNFFSECISKAPGLVTSSANYVKKVVFPLEILTPVTLIAALFHLLAGYSILFLLMLFSSWEFSWHTLLLPVVFAPFLVLILGLTWGLSALGVYLRDVGQLIAPILTAMMFLSPIFYPLSSVHEKYLWIYQINPLTFIIEQTRAVLLESQIPNWNGYLLYSAVSVVVAFAGFAMFQKTRKGFADVL
ncbi:lipopolysaccharide transport system permease protein [Halopseudomonas xinjiangensis]|uniref:Transport permease protein n=1 Tax=Halopseudomonas xinjiangensis TaxID=487184 RepID=A0A1H1NN35_9GAMM|nr:ABC transporter permease [Halopseudomonas xinjiangensis]SDS00378.1 lipopolysaccharide transport system permease protein [Halopseudomonas xinjiangensis]